MHPLPLPTVLDHLPSSTGPAPWIFIKPTVGKEIVVLNQEDTDSSPKPEKMAFRLLILSQNQVIPVHVHMIKEKLYIAQGSGCLTVVIYRNGKVETYRVDTDNQRLLVPAGCPHTLIYTGVRPCTYLVITSTNDAHDIQWEKAADDLVRTQNQLA